MTTKLSEKIIYLGDNGRAFCGSLRCAGMTAYYSGRDLSGQRVLPITPRKAHAEGIVCEGCGLSPRLVEAFTTEGSAS